MKIIKKYHTTTISFNHFTFSYLFSYKECLPPSKKAKIRIDLLKKVTNHSIKNNQHFIYICTLITQCIAKNKLNL